MVLMANEKLVFRIVNIWMAFIALLMIATQVSHWEHVPWNAWVNEALYFLLFLLSLAISLVEPNNKEVYINMAILFFIHSLSFVNVFMGEGYLFGSTAFAFNYYIYKNIIFIFLFNFCIIYSMVRYLFSRQSKAEAYGLTLLILLPVFIYNFHPFLLGAKWISNLGGSVFPVLFKRILMTHFLSLFLMIGYGVKLLKTDRNMGHYINTINALFFVFLVILMADAVSEVYQFQIYATSQIILTSILIFFGIVLVKKLYFINSEYGQFYESLIRNQGRLGRLAVKRHNSDLNTQLVQLARGYLTHRRNYLFLLSYATASVIVYFRFPRYTTLNFFIIVFSVAVVFWVIAMLYKKRQRQHFIMR